MDHLLRAIQQKRLSKSSRILVPLLFQCDQPKSQLCNTILVRHSFIKFSNKIFAITHWLLMAIIKGIDCLKSEGIRINLLGISQMGNAFRTKLSL